LARTFRRQQNGQVSAAIQSVGVLVRLFGFLLDETSGANPEYLIYYSLGFAPGGGVIVDLCFRDSRSSPDKRTWW
jgi:hypothetical protein